METLSPSTMPFPEMCERSTLRTSVATNSITIWQLIMCCLIVMGFSIMPEMTTLAQFSIKKIFS